MISRRTFLQRSTATYAASTLPFAKLASAAGTAAAEDPLLWVDPKIGTGGHGHCFPGAAMPFGAVQLSPDTFNDGWDWCSGYHISDTSIMGFSHTHLSGTGCGDLLDFLVMAGTGPAKVVPGSRENPSSGYRSRFDHADETLRARLLLRSPEGLRRPRRTHRYRARGRASLHLPGKRSVVSHP